MGLRPGAGVDNGARLTPLPVRIEDGLIRQPGAERGHHTLVPIRGSEALWEEIYTRHRRLVLKTGGRWPNIFPQYQRLPS